MSSAQVRKLISIAEQELGTKESPPNSNSVKYNDWYYGRKVSGSPYPWCVVFIMWMFNTAGLSHLIYGGKKTASCTTLMNFAKQNGLFYTKDFKPGDLALFDFDNDKSKSEHIGIIVEVKSGSVITIEGNTSTGNDSNGGEVMRRTRSNSLIIGVYRPKYIEDKIEFTESEDEDNMPRFNTITQIPEWARPTVKKLIDKGIIQGSGKKDAQGLPADLNLTEDMLRLLVFNDRAGVYK